MLNEGKIKKHVRRPENYQPLIAQESKRVKFPIVRLFNREELAQSQLPNIIIWEIIPRKIYWSIHGTISSLLVILINRS